MGTLIQPSDANGTPHCNNPHCVHGGNPHCIHQISITLPNNKLHDKSCPTSQSKVGWRRNLSKYLAWDNGTRIARFQYRYKHSCSKSLSTVVIISHRLFVSLQMPSLSLQIPSSSLQIPSPSLQMPSPSLWMPHPSLSPSLVPSMGRLMQTRLAFSTTIIPTGEHYLKKPRLFIIYTYRS